MAAARRPRRGLLEHADGLVRCQWTGEHPDYVAYHDTEWGRPSFDDGRLFEKVCLEGFQSGLSWLTILRKREAFRRAFARFDYDRVARFNTRSVDRLLGDAGIVRHRGKIEATIANARCARALADEFGSLGAFFWQFEPAPVARSRGLSFAELKKRTESPESRAMSKALRERGWRFVGPTTLYAFMQAMGLVNDHLDGCALRAEVEAERLEARRPPRPAPPS